VSECIGAQEVAQVRWLSIMKFYLRNVLSRLAPNFLQKYGLRKVWQLYNRGAYEEAYALLHASIEGQPSYCGNLYVLCAELELRLNQNPYRALDLLEKAEKLGCLDLPRFYEIRGHARWNAGEQDQGIQDLENSIALAPTVDKLINQGRLLSSSHDIRSTSIWEQVLERDLNNCPAHIFMGIEAARSGNREKAVYLAARARELATTAEDSLELARLYENMDMFEDALNAYLEADRLGLKDKEMLYIYIGDCHVSLGDGREATRYLKKAIKLGLNNDYTKGLLLWVADKEESSPILDSLVKEVRDTCIGFILRAQLAIKRKNSTESREMLSRAEKLDPSPAEMRYVGCMYHDLGQWKKALSAYHNCLRRGYHEKRLLYDSLADCHYYLKDFGAAIECASRAVGIDFTDDYAKDILLRSVQEAELGPTIDSLVEERGNTCFAFVLLAHKAIKQKKASTAHEMIVKAEQLDPSMAEMYSIGCVYRSLGQFDKALDVYLTCESLGYNNKDLLHASIADCYYLLGNYDASMRYAKKVIAENPDNEEAKELLQLVEKELDNRQDVDK